MESHRAVAKKDKDIEKEAKGDEAEVVGEGGESAKKERVPLRGRRDLWQVPLMLLGVVLVVTGAARLMKPKAPPDYTGALDRVSAYLDGTAEDIETGAGLLSTVGELVGTGALSTDEESRYYLLRGDLAHVRLASADAVSPERSQQIVENYEIAETRYDAEVTGDRVIWMCQALIDVGRMREAMDVARRIGDTSSTKRLEYMRKVIESDLASGVPSIDEAARIDAITEIRDASGATTQDRLWAVGRLVQIQIDEGNYDDAIRRLSAEILLLDESDSPDAAPLYLMLGKAYLDMDSVAMARDKLRLAVRYLPEGSQMFGEAELYLAQALQRDESFEEARDRYADLAERYRGTPVGVAALLGLAEVDSDLGQVNDSLRSFSQTVGAVSAGLGASTVTPAMVDRAIGQRFRERLLSGDNESALRYARLAVALYPEGEMPVDAVIRLAEAEYAVASQRMENAPLRTDGSIDWAAVDPIVAEEARAGFKAAGDRFAEYSRRDFLADPGAAGEALWMAAEAYDHAGAPDLAVAALKSYVQEHRDDARWVEAKFRLARAFQASGEYESAKVLYEEITNEHASSRFAYQCYGPLAACYLLLSNDEDWQRAESKLLAVIDGGVLEPDSPEFREALLDLGLMYRRIGKYELAIERLAEALTRYPDLGERPDVVMALADSSRLAASAIEDEFVEAMPLSERQRLRSVQKERLLSALDAYTRVRDIIDDRGGGNPRRADAERLRNALFFRAECAYELGKHDSAYFEQAIGAYDAVAQKYADDPASLVALVQIVNCYDAMGRPFQAQTAHQRAKARLRDLPAEAWRTSKIPMSRQQWEDWLETSLRIEREMAEAPPG